MLASVVAMAVLAAPAQAGDAEVAAALAGSALTLHGQGRAEKARELCYKALAQDEHCVEALGLLGRILDEEGSAQGALVFYQAALQEWTGPLAGRGEADQRAGEIKRRMAALNPTLAGLTAAMEEYAQELEALATKAPDRATREDIAARLAGLRLERYVAPEKLPSIAASGPSERADPVRPTPAPPSTKAAAYPDAERALRSAGWTVVTGAWKPMEKNVFEVTDGRIEAPHLYGAVSVVVHRGGGEVAVFARYRTGVTYSSSTWPRDRGRYSYAPGFGAILQGSAASLYGPYQYYRTRDNVPHFDYDARLADAPKHGLALTVSSVNNATRMEVFIDGKRERLWQYQLPDGPFVIMVRGTATLELPQVKGQ
jgi:tetratricopeptide (TPR) repeat protein